MTALFATFDSAPRIVVSASAFGAPHTITVGQGEVHEVHFQIRPDRFDHWTSG